MRCPRSLAVTVFIAITLTITLTSLASSNRLEHGLPHLRAGLASTISSVAALSPYLFRYKSQDSIIQPSSPYYRAAFATFLSGPDDSDVGTGYFLGARLLAYSLLHDTNTSTINGLPLLVLVTPDVPCAFRDRLTLDGATIIEVPHIHTDWIKPGDSRWRDVLAKLHIFNLTSYRKICFLDADTLVTSRLDEIFEDAGVRAQYTREDAEQIHTDEASLPGTYAFAAHAEALGLYEHKIPPEPHGYLNSGFFVLSPSTTLFGYYLSLLKASVGPARFSGRFPEQDLLNYAHRWNGNMPWKQFADWRWNVNWPTKRDWEAGAKSFHAKYWEPKGSGGHDDMLWEMWQAKKRSMEKLLGV
jgi:alpha-N-acetylglucosamine transferase